MKLESFLAPELRKSLKKIKAENHWYTEMLTVQGFEALHRVGRSGSNQEGGLVELVTMHREVEISRMEMRKGYFTFYVKYPRRKPQGFAPHSFQAGSSRYQTRDDNGCFADGNWGLVVRKGNKTLTITDWHDDDERLPHRLVDLIGDVAAKRFGSNRSVQRDVETLSTRSKGDTYTVELEQVLTVAGVKILDAFTFDAVFTFRPEYMTIDGYKVEFGFHTCETYHSLPRVVTFDLNPEIKVTRLADLGIEESGYHSHHAHHTVRKGQVKQAKAFAAKFAAKVAQKV